MGEIQNIFFKRGNWLFLEVIDNLIKIITYLSIDHMTYPFMWMVAFRLLKKLAAWQHHISADIKMNAFLSTISITWLNLELLQSFCRLEVWGF